MRRIFFLALTLLLGLQLKGFAGDAPVVTTLPGGVGADGTSNTDTTGNNGGGGGPKVTPVATCPGYETRYSAPAQGPQIGADGGYYAWEHWRCPPNQNWTTRIVCVAQCPPGTPTAPYTAPPTNEQIKTHFARFVVKPLGKFAPPIEQTGVKATVGMRFYYSVDPSTYQPITPPTQTFPGGWQVTATLTPTTITLEAGDKTSTCNGPGTPGTTKTGRNQADTEGCYTIFETVPETKQQNATLTTNWTITITATTIGQAVALTWTQPATTPYTITLRQLQAVGTNN